MDCQEDWRDMAVECKLPYQGMYASTRAKFGNDPDLRMHLEDLENLADILCLEVRQLL